jgi:AbiV family abortive infection protein
MVLIVGANMANRTLTFQQVEDLYSALLSNAWRLSREAEALAAVGANGRARALAIVALEECGKAIMIHKAKIISHDRGHPAPVLDDQFWRDWRNHQPKLREVRAFILNHEYWFAEGPPEPHDLVLGPVEDYLADLDVFADQQSANRMSGLYVDVDKSTGRPRKPYDEIGDDVPELVAIADQVGWQLRLGDHIQFIAKAPDRSAIPATDLYAAYADGGHLAAARTSSEGWEAQDASLVRMMETGSPYGDNDPDEGL